MRSRRGFSRSRRRGSSDGAWIDTLVLAILLGTAIRTAWAPDARFAPGITFSARVLLEIAVALLGASLSAQVAGQAALV